MIENHWEEKCWGRACHIFQSDHAAVSLLEVKEGFRCSRHFHQDRVNQFTVVSGEIQIKEWEQDGLFLRSTILTAGRSCVVPDHVIHQFLVMKSGLIVEVYWSADIGCKVRIDDITRLDEGGLITEENVL